MRCRHTGNIKLAKDSLELVFPSYKITIEFGDALPRFTGDWKPVSLFCVYNNFNLLLLKHGNALAFWLLDAEFHLFSNDVHEMQVLLDYLLLSAVDEKYDYAFMYEVQGLLSHHSGCHEEALSAFLKACDVGDLRDVEAYSALIDASSRLGKLSDTLPLVESVLDKPGFFSMEQAAIPKALLGRSYADCRDFARGHKLLAAAIAGFANPPDWLSGLLDYCARQDTSPQFGEPPQALMAEVAEFGRASLEFLAGRHCIWRPGRYPTMTVARHWVRRMVRVIHIEPGDTESLELLRAGGVSPAFLQAVIQGRDGVGEACFAASWDVPFASDPAISLRVKEVAATILLGGKPILCPFTGQRDLARDTINLHTFLHRKHGRTCIIFSDPDISLAPADCAWFFPDLDIILTHGWNMQPEIDLATTLQRVMDNIQEVESYITSPERVVMISEEGMGHIGHYIWNVISGWKALFDLVSAKKIKVLTSYQSGHFFGGVTDLYRDEIHPVAQVLRPIGREDAFQLMLKHRGLSLILRDRNVTDDLARRVRIWCQGHTSSEFLNALAAFRKASDPLILITIRVENRAWVKQENGFIEIINNLVAEHPRLGVVIDGLNAPPTGTTTFAPMSMAGEQAIAERIIAACPTVQFINAIGCTPAEGVLWCDVIDAFVAPIGAGLAKSRWICNKPGVGFSNRTFLEDGHFEGYLYSHFREEQSTMLYVAREHVSDVDSGHHGQIGRANFSMDWRAPLAELRTLLSASRREAA